MRLTLQKILMIMMALYIVFSAIFYITLNRYYKDESYKRIEQAVEFNKALQDYVNYVQKPFLSELKKNQQLSKSFFHPKLSSSSYIVNQVNDNYVKLASHTVHIKFASDNPINNRNTVNAYEKKVLSEFRKKNLVSYKDSLTINGKEHLFYALSVPRNTDACLECHGNPVNAPKEMRKLYNQNHGFNENVGDLRAIMGVYTSIEDEQGEMFLFFITIEVLMLAIFGLIYYLIVYFEQKLSFKDKLISEQSRLAAMGEMIEMIAHQWRQPLTGMGMTINNLKLDIELSTIDEEKWDTQLTVIEGQIAYLSHTIDDFRNFFKPNQERMLVYINKVIESTTNLVASTLKNHDIKLIIDCNENIVALTSKNELMQVLLNLVKNTIDAYIDSQISSPIIEIIATEDEAYINIVVKDNAGGIPSDIINRIFISYFTTKGEKNGSGMGLYMSKIIIEEHLGGKLDVESENGSTTFMIKLPIGSNNGN